MTLSSSSEMLAYLDECEPRREWNPAFPWVIVHLPTGERVSTPRALPNGERYLGYGHRLKRDAIAALAELRTVA
jgi:hypothetical protein